MKKKVIVTFDREAYNEYLELKNNVFTGKKDEKKPTYKQLLSSIDNAINNLKLNPYHGDLIPRKYISKAVINRYGTDKIFRLELVGFWRLIYTVTGNEIEIIAFILEFMDHNKYDKIFGYRKK